MDVLDQVVVSGYVHAYESYDGEPPEVYDFTITTPGTGLTEPLPWLLNSIYRALVSEERTARRGTSDRPSVGGAHSISETGDRADSLMG